MNGAARSRKLFAGLLALVMTIGVLLAIFRGYLPGDFGERIGQNVPQLDGSTITVAPGLHLIGELGPAAAYAVETPEGLILIDSGLDADAQPLKLQMAALGLDWKKIHAIFLTHVHGDHSGGAEYLRTATGATVYAGEADAPILRAGGPRDAIFSTFDMPHHSPHPTTVDVALAGDETLPFGNVRVRILGTPGHTPGSICYLIERAGLRVLFTGDVIQDFNDQPLGTYSTYLAPRYRGDAQAYLTSLRMLRALPMPDLILPGHPNSNRTPRSPRLTQGRWAALLDSGIDEMLRLVERYEVDGASFLDGHPKRLLPELYYLGDFGGAAVYGFFVSSNFFLVNAPGGRGLSDFVKDRLRELGKQPAEPTAVLLTACGELETAGLRELVERTGAQVVASAAGLQGIKELCPPETIVVTADKLPAKGWFTVNPMALAGRGESPVAYFVEWGEKSVLFSGTIPAGIDANPPGELLTDLAQSRSNTVAFNAALQRLARVKPDLWLPTVPYHGRNANVYGGEWADLLEKNRRAAAYVLQGSANSQRGPRQQP